MPPGLPRQPAHHGLMHREGYCAVVSLAISVQVRPEEPVQRPPVHRKPEPLPVSFHHPSRHGAPTRLRADVPVHRVHDVDGHVRASRQILGSQTRPGAEELRCRLEATVHRGEVACGLGDIQRSLQRRDRAGEPVGFLRRSLGCDRRLQMGGTHPLGLAPFTPRRHPPSAPPCLGAETSQAKS